MGRIHRISKFWSGRRESNPRIQLGRLLHYHYATPAILRLLSNTIALELNKQEKWWRGQDSNLCTHTRADLQSAAFNHSATPPWMNQTVIKLQQL